jgi:predicted aspartyl protease
LRIPYTKRPPFDVLIIDVEIAKYGDPQKKTIKAKIDTGADCTAIPEEIIKDLNLSPSGACSSMGAFGDRQDRPTYFITITINGLIEINRDVLSIDRNQALLGRDVLNLLVLCANGPAGYFDLSNPVLK